MSVSRILYDFEPEWDSLTDSWYKFWRDINLPDLMY